MERGLGFDILAEQLYATAPDLQVSPRRRKFTTGAATAIPATGQAQATATIVLDAADILAAGDGLLFDFLQIFGVAAAAPGLTVVALDFAIQNAAATNEFIIGQPTQTLAALPVTPMVFPSQVTVSPSLLTSFDINFGLNLGTGSAALPAAQQPLKLVAQATVANSTAGAINATITLVAFYRKVRGLQEG